MKTICILLCTLAAAVSAPIEELKMASGRPLQKASVVEVTSKGVIVRHARGRGLIKFSEFTKDAILKIGAVDLWGGPVEGENYRLRGARKDIQVCEPQRPDETKSEYQNRYDFHLKRMEGWVISAIKNHKDLLKKAAEQESEGIDSVATHKQANLEIAIAMSFGYALAEKQAEAKSAR